MTFEEAITALKQGKKVRRQLWQENHNCNIDYIELHNGKNALFQCFDTTFKGCGVQGSRTREFSANDVLSDDWEIVGEEKPKEKNKHSGYVVTVTSNFDEYMQAVDKFRCRLDDLQQAVEKLNGMKLEIKVDI